MTSPIRTNASVAYASVMNIYHQYDEMAAMLQKIRNLTTAAADGAKVDWTGVGKEIDGLQAFQPAKEGR